MVSDSAAIDAACRAAGIVRVATPKDSPTRQSHVSAPIFPVDVGLRSSETEEERASSWLTSPRPQGSPSLSSRRRSGNVSGRSPRRSSPTTRSTSPVRASRISRTSNGSRRRCWSPGRWTPSCSRATSVGTARSARSFGRGRPQWRPRWRTGPSPAAARSRCRQRSGSLRLPGPCAAQASPSTAISRAAAVTLARLAEQDGHHHLHVRPCGNADCAARRPQRLLRRARAPCRRGYPLRARVRVKSPARAS